MTTARSAIKILRRFHIFMRRTTISHFSFLISHSSRAFIHNQGGSTPEGLTLNPLTLLFYPMQNDILEHIHHIRTRHILLAQEIRIIQIVRRCDEDHAKDR